MTLAAEADISAPAANTNHPTENALRDGDRGSIHVLPLSILPLQTVGLDRTRMIKNAKFESVIEVFGGDKSGSGQVPVGAIRQVYADINPKDFKLLGQLAKLYSYDVYCLRIELRKLGIPTDDAEHLKLSPAKQDQLQRFMSAFTQRVIIEVYGDSGAGGDAPKSFNDVVKLFRQPDKRNAIVKLKRISDRLGIELEEVPAFLDDFGDIYLSMAYYREYWESVQPALSDFVHTVEDIMAHHTLKQDRTLLKTCDELHGKFADLGENVGKRIHLFERQSNKLWDDINSNQFGSFKTIVQKNHTAIGGTICKLSVKMNAWMEKFPHHDSGGAVKRAEFIRLTMQQGV